VVGVCDGFVGNRMLHKRTKEAERLLLEGALPQDVDAAVVEFGFPMGPYAMGDLAGLDVGWRIRQHRGDKAPVSDALCEAGRFGQKTSAGYYRYEAGSRTPVPDPEVERLIAETQQRMGITPRKIDKQEIIERMIYPMINEGARILEEGIALRPSDIDVVWVYGYGWPVWRGGPMHYADQVGLAHIRDRLAFYAERAGDPGLEPAALSTALRPRARASHPSASRARQPPDAAPASLGALLPAGRSVGCPDHALDPAGADRRGGGGPRSPHGDRVSRADHHVRGVGSRGEPLRRGADAGRHGSGDGACALSAEHAVSSLRLLRRGEGRRAPRASEPHRCGARAGP
jgi:3-hydroxyacyl-CoA dehydrogenase